MTVPTEYQLNEWLESGGHRGWKIPEDCSDVVFHAALDALLNHAMKPKLPTDVVRIK